MEKIIEYMLSKKTWAVVGATQNQSKFGYKIFKRLKDAGYDVYPVNPMYDLIDDATCYPRLSEIPVKVDCVNIVVSPERAMSFVSEAKELNLSYLWFQPGAFDDSVIEMAEKDGGNAVYHHCVLVELNNRGK